RTTARTVVCSARHTGVPRWNGQVQFMATERAISTSPIKPEAVARFCNPVNRKLGLDELILTLVYLHMCTEKIYLAEGDMGPFRSNIVLGSNGPNIYRNKYME